MYKHFWVFTKVVIQIVLWNSFLRWYKNEVLFKKFSPHEVWVLFTGYVYGLYCIAFQHRHRTFAILVLFVSYSPHDDAVRSEDASPLFIYASRPNASNLVGSTDLLRWHLQGTQEKPVSCTNTLTIGWPDLSVIKMNYLFLLNRLFCWYHQHYETNH